MCSNFVSDIQEDINGNLWFTTSEGVCRFVNQTFSNFTEILKTTSKENSQPKNEDLFFFQEGNIYVFDGKTFSKLTIHPPDYKVLSTNLERPYGVYCVLKDNTGKFWLGTDQKGVCCYDGNSLTYYTDKGLDKGAVRAVFKDKNGNVWFGNNGYGLFLYNGKTLTNFTEEKGLGNPDFLKKKESSNSENLARVWSINEDKNGNLWIGTIDSGVWMFDGENLKKFTTKDGLANNKISTIYKDNQNELWFITEGEGVSKFDGKRFTKFTVQK